MDIIGRHLLHDFCRRHPESEPALRGVLALIAAASWRNENDIKLQLGSAARTAGEGRLVIADPDGRFLLDIRLNYDRQLIHIIAIQRGDA